MDRREFIEMVQRAAGTGPEEAERATRAVLATLAERIVLGEARDLVERLPPELGPLLLTDPPTAERFDVGEFLRRVAGRERVDPATAERHAGAVLAALARAVGPDEFADLVAELPRDFAPLLPRGPMVPTAAEFWQAVADRTGLDADGATTATDAVLEALAEVIAPGEVDDLVARLPVALHQALERGRARNPGRARPVPLERFLARVSELEGVTDQQASAHARAVLTTLRELVGEEAFSDVAVQLPPPYAVLWPPPGRRPARR